MIDQNLLNYIQLQLQNGVSKDQIKSSLLSNGWQDSVIEEAFATLVSPVAEVTSQETASSPENQEVSTTTETVAQEVSAVTATSPTTTTTKMSLGYKLVIFLIIGIFLATGGFYVANETFLKNPNDQTTNDTQSSLNGNTESGVPSELADLNAKWEQQSLAFAESLRTCTNYQDTHVFPLNLDNWEYSIFGIQEGRCFYMIRQPEKVTTECRLTESERLAAAQYYKKVATAESFGTSMSVDINQEGIQTDSRIILDGQPVDDLFKVLFERQSCVFVGIQP